MSGASRRTRAVVLNGLQRDLEKRYPQTTVLPWFLRGRALTQPLEPCELGRALYHLAQRRGFLSNRVSAKDEKEEKECSDVKKAIQGLQAAIESADKQTFGAYMASLDPQVQPLRNKAEVFSDHYTLAKCISTSSL